jgi:hypothetical protein
MNQDVQPNVQSDLQSHILVPDQDRDFGWDEKFFKLLSQAQISIISTEPQQGPDHWPYLLSTTSLTDKFPIDLAQRSMRWLSEKGIGLVVNPDRKPYPDYVFSYGMIWFFRETGFFMLPPKEGSQISSQLANAENKWFTGAPSDQYLPKYVRQVLKNFFADQMKHQVKIMMLSTDQKNYDLAFSLESLGNPPQAEHAQIAEALAWFLPPHYSVALVAEAGFPAFAPL